MPTNIGLESAQKHSYFMSAKGPTPPGPDPFSLVSEELKPLSDYVKEMVVSENPVLTMAASHFFEKRQGKRFRPTIVALIGRALAPSLSEYVGSNLNTLQLQLGQITEMIHVASLIHDDVLDEADTRRGGAAVHTLYTNKVAVLAGDYLLARASVLLARLQHLQVVEVMASALDALVGHFFLHLSTSSPSPPHATNDCKPVLVRSRVKSCRPGRARRTSWT
jgi:geranylgeranyl pyrophosphate synthase